jgi:hypothetical protein
MHKEKQDQVKEQLGAAYHNQDLVFCTYTGNL